VLAFRRLRRRVLLVALLAAAPVAARAQGKLDASYTVTLAGIPIGKGGWSVDVSETRYTASVSGQATGLMRVFTGAHGETNASGKFADGQLVSSTYDSTITSYKKTDKIHLILDNGEVKEVKLDPPQDKDPQRVPVTEENERGIVDPMNAALLHAPGTGAPLSPEACQRTLSVFDGRTRYDLQLAYKRMEKVKADNGYAGPAMVCAAYFSPIAGYVPSRLVIRYISKLRDMEVWLVPIAGTRMLAPFRAQSPTPLGEVVMTADKFVTVPASSRASANGLKTQ